MVNRMMQYGYEVNLIYFLLPKNAKTESLYENVNLEMFKEPFLVLENVKTELTQDGKHKLHTSKKIQFNRNGKLVTVEVANPHRLHAPKKIQFNRNGELVTIDVANPEAYIYAAPLSLIGRKCFSPRIKNKFEKGKTYKSYWGDAEEYLKMIGSIDANQKCCAFRNFIKHCGNYFTVLKVDNVGIVEAIGSQGRIYTRPDASAFVYHSSAWFFTEI